MSVSPLLAVQQWDPKARAARMIPVDDDGNYAGSKFHSVPATDIREPATGPVIKSPLPLQRYALYGTPSPGFDHAFVHLEVSFDGVGWVVLQTLEISGTVPNAIFVQSAPSFCVRWKVTQITPGSGKLDLGLIAIAG